MDKMVESFHSTSHRIILFNWIHISNFISCWFYLIGIFESSVIFRSRECNFQKISYFFFIKLDTNWKSHDELNSLIDHLFLLLFKIFFKKIFDSIFLFFSKLLQSDHSIEFIRVKFESSIAN